MTSRRKPTPSYLLHRLSGRARAVWTAQSGTRYQKLLPGPFDSTESRTAFARLLLELEVAPHAVADPSGLAVAELLLAYLTHAEQHYRGPDGEPTDEVRHVKAACRYVRELYGDAPVSEFGPLALKAVRQQFVAAGWCRKTINARIERIRRAFKWGVAEELVSPTVHQALIAVEGLKRGRTPARETEPVGPVDDSTVDSTLPHLNRHVRGLVEFQRLTGCRPGEACGLRRSEIDTGGTVWLYKPAQHKGTWRGNARTIAVGPKAQELIRGYFTPSIDDYLFSPARAVEEFQTHRAAERKTPRYPSHMKRNAAKRVGAKRKRPPAARYVPLSYAIAVGRACRRAFLPVGPFARRTGESAAKWWKRLKPAERDAVETWRKSHHWHPNQLRHTFATRVRKQARLGSRTSALGALAGGRHASLCRAERRTGRVRRGHDRIEYRRPGSRSSYRENAPGCRWGSQIPRVGPEPPGRIIWEHVHDRFETIASPHSRRSDL